jgi:hypothetical protein
MWSVRPGLTTQRGHPQRASRKRSLSTISGSASFDGDLRPPRRIDFLLPHATWDHPASHLSKIAISHWA